jgi:hypothetical protein
MNKNELKKALRPIVKECIKEVLFEEGILSGIVSEVAIGLGASRQVIAEAPTPRAAPVRDLEAEASTRRSQVRAASQGLMESIGREAYAGVDLFEGTTPTSTGGSATPEPSGPLAGTNPTDPGVDISGLVSLGSTVWDKLK